ncbi:Zn2+ dependent hydrolase [Penicillium taxi]|uniref:Zn2+ dependent hydrolase n=1 Tax=Penicillium taxi TaxID=168475 RepID=UPI00254512A5|nr:Zn2+ dependent hydrolase [Penicillium taxi]KAJ5895651.1 Zn2+ dependent hydrolase [Penicillium taxi]
MAPQLNITHIGTATAVLEINGVNFLTDPFFSPAGSSWKGFPIILEVSQDPAMSLDQLPVIDVILLSHEDHPDNLDELGRQLLNGRHVFTTVNGAKNLAPRPAVHGMKPWEKIDISIAGKLFQIIATPTQHAPEGECVGFIVTGADFGHGRDGIPNAIYFSGDTVYIDELKSIADRFHVLAAVLNLGNAQVPTTADANGPSLQVTMDGKDAARLFRDLKANVLVPMHYESWLHFTQLGAELREAFEAEGISDKIRWLKGGEKLSIVLTGLH